MSDHVYVLGTDDLELQRLGLQHRLWSAPTHELWARARVRPGLTVLDLGCGPGFTTADLARLTGPTGRVIGIDASARFVDHVNEQAATRHMPWMSARAGSVTDLPAVLHDIDPGTIDAIFGRWILCFVDDPAATIDQAATMLRPGGVVAFQEYFNYAAMSLMPRDPAFSAVIDAIKASWAHAGGDADIAGRIPDLCVSAGLHVTDITPHARAARPGDQLWAWPDSFWPSVVPRLVDAGHLTREQARDFDAAWQRATAANACIALPTVYDIIARKPNA